MKTRNELLDTLARSTEPTEALMVIGILLADIREALVKMYNHGDFTGQPIEYDKEASYNPSPEVATHANERLHHKNHRTP